MRRLGAVRQYFLIQLNWLFFTVRKDVGVPNGEDESIRFAIGKAHL